MKKSVVFLAGLLIAMTLIVGVNAIMNSSTESLSPQFAIVNPPFYVNSCKAETTGITLEIENNGGETYNLINISISNCSSTLTAPGEIVSGAVTNVTIPCSLSEGSKFRGDITITYSKAGSSLELVSKGTIAKIVINGSSSGRNPSGRHLNYTRMDDCIGNDTDCINFVRTNISFCSSGETKNFTCGDRSEVEICRCSSGRWVCDIENAVKTCGSRTREMIRERIQNRTNFTFLPWQKINESECMEGCKCRGAVVSCVTENGRTINITAGNSGNYIYIYVEQTGANASTKMEIITYSNGNVTIIKVVTSNGSEIEIKIMPDEAQERALEKVKVRACNSENNCNLTLKEEKNKLKYEIQLKRHSRILGIFQKKMQIRTEVDAETGEIIKITKPWWAFLATEPKE